MIRMRAISGFCNCMADLRFFYYFLIFPLFIIDVSFVNSHSFFLSKSSLFPLPFLAISFVNSHISIATWLYATYLAHIFYSALDGHTELAAQVPEFFLCFPYFVLYVFAQGTGQIF